MSSAAATSVAEVVDTESFSAMSSTAMSPTATGTATRTPQPCRPRIRVLPAPRREPPFDDEVTPSGPVGRYDQPLPFALTPAPLRRRAHIYSRARASYPDPMVFTRSLVTGLLEALGGRRSMAQLAPFVSRSIYIGLTNDIDSTRTARIWRAGSTVRSVHLCEPTDGVVEASVVVAVSGRVRAIALRLEHEGVVHEGMEHKPAEHDRTHAGNGTPHAHQWRCVRLQIG